MLMETVQVDATDRAILRNDFGQLRDDLAEFMRCHFGPRVSGGRGRKAR